MNLSPLSQELYKQLLTTKQPLNAKQLAKHLGVVPNTIYRLAEPLAKMGLITQTEKYPLKYTAKEAEEGLSLFLLAQNDWFFQKFNDPKLNKKGASQSQQVSLTFIQGRDELMNLSAQELNQIYRSVDLIRSGHEIPADVMLALIQAKNRGVNIRMLIQDYSGENSEQVRQWQRNGIEVRVTSLKQIRLMIYDNQRIYFMSYKHPNSKDDLGMKIDYHPLAIVMSELFDRWWEKGKVVN